MAVQEKLYTAEEFYEYAQLPENADRRLELIEGVIHEMPPASPKHTVIAVRIAASLLQHVDRHNLGYVTGADGGFQLGPREVRAPDCAFISSARLPELPEKLFPIAPDLAVEVISPSERLRQILDKVNTYLQAGTRLVWVVYPDEKVIDVWQPGEGGGMRVRTLKAGDTLDGGEVLPGFVLKVSEVFGRIGES